MQYIELDFDCNFINYIPLVLKQCIPKHDTYSVAQWKINNAVWPVFSTFMKYVKCSFRFASLVSNDVYMNMKNIQ